MEDGNGGGGNTNIRVVLRPARYPCNDCGHEVVPVVVGVLPALVVTFGEESGQLSAINIDSTGPADLEELAGFLESLADSLRSGSVSPVEGGDGG